MAIFALLMILFSLALMVIVAKIDDGYPQTLILILLVLIILFLIALLMDSNEVANSHIKAYEERKLEKVITITDSDTTCRYRYKRE